jgi:hypothetical protein
LIFKKGNTEMRLSCNLLLPGEVFYHCGESIPDHLVPKHALQYRISEAEGRQLAKEMREFREQVAARRAAKSKKEAVT